MGCISVQHKCCLHSMVAVNLPPLASLTSKCEDTSDGIASALAIFVCLYQQNLFWYQQDPYIPTGAKLYPQNPKGTHTVLLALSEGKPLVTGGRWNPTEMDKNTGFDVFFNVSLNKLSNIHLFDFHVIWDAVTLVWLQCNGDIKGWNITVKSWWTRCRLKTPASRLFIQPFNQT